MRASKGVFIALLLACAPAAANEANHQPFIVGDRAGGMGGAVAADATAVDACYHNPAGIAWAETNFLSVSASVYGFQRFRLERGVTHDVDLETDTFVTLPTAVGTVWDLGDKAAVGFSAFVPKRFARDVVQWEDRGVVAARYSEQDQTLWIGPTLAYRPLPRLALGASAFLTYRTHGLSSVLYRGDLGGMLSRDYTYSSGDALAVLGAQYRIGERLSLGLRLQSPSVHLTGGGKATMSFVSLADGGQTWTIFTDDLETRNSTPPSVRAGISWAEPRRWGAGLDVEYHFSNSYQRLEGRFSDGDPVLSTEYRNEDVIDLGLGGEYFLRERYPLRAGVFTSRSAARDLAVGAPVMRFLEITDPQKIDLVGFTVSLGSETESTKTNLGLMYVFGTGSGLGPDETGAQLVETDAEERALYVFLGSSYLF